MRPFASPILSAALFVASLVALAAAVPRADAGVQALERTGAGHPAARVQVDGHGELLFVVDTGASASAVYEHARSRLRLTPEPGAQIEMHGAAGSQRVDRYRLPGLTVAGVRADRLLATGLPDGVKHSDEVMGVIGRDVFGGHAVEFDLARGVLGLHRPGALPASARGWVEMPMRLMPGIGFVMLEVELDGKPVTAVLDTGARKSFINWRAARQTGIAPGAKGLVRQASAGGATAHRFAFDVARFGLLAVGGTRIAAPSLAIADLPVFAPMGMDGAPAMILGMDLLGDRRFVIDYPGRRLLVEKRD